MIEFADVTVRYPTGVKALKDVSLRINLGEFVYVVGPSGAGKTTLVKLIYLEERPSSGRVFVNNVDVSQVPPRRIPFLRRNIGVVFQDFRLLPRLTAFENVRFAMEAVEAPPKLIHRRVMEALDQVGLAHRADAFPEQLSGGEQQRVALARAIVNRPKILVADEPTGNLDPETSWEIVKLLENISVDGTTVVMATHDREIVNARKKRVIELDGGRIVRDQQRGMYAGVSALLP